MQLANGWLTQFFADVNGSASKKCKKCSKVVKSTDAATSNFARHLRNDHTNEVIAFNKEAEAKRSTRPIEQYIVRKPGAIEVKLSAHRKAEIDEAIVEYVCIDLQPLTIKNAEGLRRLLAVLAPGYDVPDYRTLRNTLLPGKVERVRADVAKLLSSAVHVAVTVDLWSSRASMAFAGVTVHAIPPDMQPRMAVLACKHFPGRHTGEAICTELCTLFEDMGISRKIVRILTDNGSNIVKAFKLPLFELESEATNDDDGDGDCDVLRAAAAKSFDGDFEDDNYGDEDNLSGLAFDRASCAAHTLQLVIKCGFKADTRVQTLLSKVSRLCSAVRKSVNNTETVLRETNLHFLSMKATRWNSQYIMIERFTRILRESPEILAELNCKVAKEIRFTTNDIRNLQDLVELLDCFNHASKILQSETSSGGALVPTLCVLWLHLSEQKDRNRFTSKMCMAMMPRMVECFGACVSDSKWLTCSVLDPRFRMAFCRPYDGFITFTAAEVRKTVFVECKKAYAEYHLQGDAGEHDRDVQRLTGTATGKEQTTSFFSSVLLTGQQDDVLRASDSENAKLFAQFNSYVSGAVIDEDADIFKFIRERAMTDCPRLIPAWRKFLCIPATSAPIECVFSTAGDIVTQDRCSLLGDVVEDLVFIKRNIRLSEKLASS